MRRVQISRFQIDATLIDSFALRRASSRGDSCTSPVVVVVGRLASTCCQRPAAKRHFSRRVWPQTPRGSLGSLTPLGSPGSYVYAHMLFLSPHLPGLLAIVCDGQHRPVRDGHFSASWGGGGGGGGYVATGPNLSISNRCDFDRFFRVTTCQQPRYVPPPLFFLLGGNGMLVPPPPPSLTPHYRCLNP